jgi:serine/threonine protein kinase
MLGITAGFQDGMNLVDISNVYMIQEGCQAPKLIALHYTAKMLKHIETLHWHGQILHCDVKPDNWV